MLDDMSIAFCAKNHVDVVCAACNCRDVVRNEGGIEMSDVKHTPGPWHKDDCGALRGSNGARVIVSGLGLAFLTGYVSEQDKAEMEANARLIAAVPDLLEALKACEPYVAHFQGGWSGHTPGNIDTAELLATIRAAIMKAEGRS
jgi:hypothetical protein